MKHRSASLFALVASLCAPPCYAGLGEGIEYYYTHRYTEAYQELSGLAEQGVSGAEEILGNMYATGDGVPQDSDLSLYWYLRAADHGSVDAMTAIGTIFEEGRGVPQDFAQAASWYRKAAQQGTSDSQLYLGRLYEAGRGVPQDYAKAIYWYRKSAAQNDGEAQIQLAKSYQIGMGVAKNLIIAYALLNLAASGSQATIFPAFASKVVNYRETVARKMDAIQIEAGQALTHRLAVKGRFLAALDQATQGKIAPKRKAPATKPPLTIKAEPLVGT